MSNREKIWARIVAARMTGEPLPFNAKIWVELLSDHAPTLVGTFGTRDRFIDLWPSGSDTWWVKEYTRRMIAKYQPNEQPEQQGQR